MVDLLNKNRKIALEQKGYISVETLINHYDPQRIMIVSTWDNVEDWVRWEGSEGRAVNEAKIEQFLEMLTKYEIYDISNL